MALFNNFADSALLGAGASFAGNYGNYADFGLNHGLSSFANFGDLDNGAAAAANFGGLNAFDGAYAGAFDGAYAGAYNGLDAASFGAGAYENALGYAF